MTKLDKIETKVENYGTILDEVAKKANNDLEISKHKITCLTVLVVLFAILGTMVAMYSIYSTKELFYDMQIEETTEKESLDVNADNGGNAVGVLGNGNEVHN